jgi:hypothetical protein
MTRSWARHRSDQGGLKRSTVEVGLTHCAQTLTPLAWPPREGTSFTPRAENVIPILWRLWLWRQPGLSESLLLVPGLGLNVLNAEHHNTNS